MSILDQKPELAEMWKHFVESAKEFRRKYRLLPDGRMVDRQEFEATEPKEPTGGDHATRP